MIKQTATYGVWTVNRHDDGKMEVLKNGTVCEKAKPALREIAEEIGFEINPDWTSQQLGVNVLKAMQGTGGSKAAKPQPKAKEEVKKPAKKEESTVPKTAKAGNDELAAAKAEIERLKAELAKAKKAETPKEEKKSKGKDPFEGLMVKVCPGIFTQRYRYERWHDAWDSYPDGDRRRKPIHHDGSWVVSSSSRKVTISKPFSICKYPVTQAQWKAIMGEGFNMSKFRGDDLPVTNISWEEVQTFIKKLNDLTGKKYRLPTEAEWQWAACGASKDDDLGDFAGCKEELELKNYAWYYNNSDNQTHPVGQKKPNELGLYDMSGNVWEICQDYYKKDSIGYWHDFGSGSVVDPCELDAASQKHILKGGCYDSSDGGSNRTLGCALSCYDTLGEKSEGSLCIGFRLAL